MNQHLKNNEQSIFNQSNVNEAFDIFNRLFLEVTDVYAPMTISETKSKCQQLFCNKLKNLKTKRNKAQRKWKENQCERTLAAFTKASDNLKEVITKKNNFIISLTNVLAIQDKHTNFLMNSRGKQMLPKLFPILESCQKNIEGPSQVDNANSFNDFFINIGSNLTKHLKNTRPRLKSNAYSIFYIKQIRLKFKKSCRV